MRLVWSGPMLLAAFLGLSGQGALLVVLGASSQPLTLPLVLLFLLTVLLLALVPVLGARSRMQSVGASPSWFDSRILLITLALALQSGLLLVQLTSQTQEVPNTVGPRAKTKALDQVESSFVVMLEKLDQVDDQVLQKFSNPATWNSDLFSEAEMVQGLWRGVGTKQFPLEVVIWGSGERLAWTAQAEPFAAVDDTASISRSVGRQHFLAQGPAGWFLRDLIFLGAGHGVALQVRIPEQLSHDDLLTVNLSVQTPAKAAQLERVHHEFGRMVHLTTGEGEPVIWCQVPAPRGDVRSLNSNRAIFLLALSWVLVLALMLGGQRIRGLGGLWPILLLAWAVRAILARLDLFNRLASLFPSVNYPASPHSWFSLLDPAYFATPALGGWLASTADALLTGLLLLGSLLLLWRHALLQMENENHQPWRPGMGLGPLPAIFFGTGTGLGLLVVNHFDGLVVVNANARMIGTGVPLASLSFWALHLVLMMGALSFVLLMGFLLWLLSRQVKACSGWDATASIVVPLAGLLATFVMPGLSWQERVLAMGLTTAFWFGLPALMGGRRFLHRLSLPVLLMLVVIWNHTVMRDLDARSERHWLEAKAEAITTSDPGWSRFLLGSILEDLQTQDSSQDLNEPTTDVWRDEPAWRLWRNSALEDLGGACLVELRDGRGEEKSLIARGFLRDFQYEVSNRSPLTDREGDVPTDPQAMTFQTEQRLYSGGDELVMIGEVPRIANEGWIRVEIPLRSWRISTLQARLNPAANLSGNQYQPRVEVGHEILLVRGDNQGWLQAADNTFPAVGSSPAIAALKKGQARWARVNAGGRTWLSLWQPLPPEAARSPGEGFLIGLQVPSHSWVLLDLSRLMLLNLVFLFLGQGLLTLRRWLGHGPGLDDGFLSWRPGFLESFLGGYLVLGLFLLLVVGMSVDRVGYESVRREARTQTREGLSLAVEQLRSLLAEQARSLAGSEYIADLMMGQLAGNRPAGPTEFRQAMVFAGDGRLLLDETLSDLSQAQAAELLAAGRSAPLVVIADGNQLHVATIIPIDLSGIMANTVDDTPAGAADGFFLYRQSLDADLLVGLADLVRGETTLMLAGQPVLASHPEQFFSGRSSQLAMPEMMEGLLAHTGSPGIFASQDRPFAFTGAMPLPAFSRDLQGRWRRDALPAVMALSFPDREREFTVQRTETVLFLTGLANLILLTALALAGILAWNIFRPLRVLADATRSLAVGDFKAPLPEPGHDEVGELTTAFGTMRSQLHSARERLAAREQFLTTVLNRVPVGVGVLDSEQHLVVLNPSGREILGDFSPGVDLALALANLRRGLADKSGFGTGREIRGRNGSRTLRGAVAPLELPDGRTDTMVVFEDITDFLTNKKLALNAELARQVAHEIKNPLTPIQLSTQLLGQAWQDQHPDLDRIVPETVGRILDQVDLLRRIASEFSLLGRPDQMVLRTLDLVVLVQQVVDHYGAGSGHDQGGDVQIPQVTIDRKDVPLVMANEESLHKILGNLMQNSLDAAGDETLVLDIRWAWNDSEVTVIWRDNGAGIPEEVAEHLFDPYFSTKTKGTGLGLAICHNLADRMGGVITLGNNPEGSGAVATLSLPRAPGTIAEDEET